MSIALREGLSGLPLKETIEDLLVRFVINCPPEDLSSLERVFFQIEEAHWFYLDFVRMLNPSLPSLKMKGFSRQIVDMCPAVWHWGDPADALARFGKYKATIPVRGVALFNEGCSKVLLVQGMESSSWSFPRGKINKDEDDVACGVRECKEETGFDASELIDENEYVERTIHGKHYKVFLVKNVPEDFPFRPLVRNEINEIKWKSWKKVVKDCRSGGSEYYLVSLMLKPINTWVSRQKGLSDEESLRKYAEARLKVLLGIGESSKHAGEAKKQIDAGKELLGILKKDEDKVPEFFQQLLQPAYNPQKLASGPLPVAPPGIPFPHFAPLYGMPLLKGPIFGQNTPLYGPMPSQNSPFIPNKAPVPNGTPNNSQLASEPTSTQKPAEPSTAQTVSGSESPASQMAILKKQVQEDAQKEAKEQKKEPESLITGDYLSVLAKKKATTPQKDAPDLLSLFARSKPEKSPTGGSNASEFLGLLKKPQANDSSASLALESTNSLNDILTILKKPAKNDLAELLGTLNKAPKNELSDLLGMLKKPAKNELTELLEALKKPAKNDLAELLGALKKPAKNELSELLGALKKPAKNELSELLGMLKNSNSTTSSNSSLADLLNILQKRPASSQSNSSSQQNSVSQSPQTDLLHSVFNGGVGQAPRGSPKASGLVRMLKKDDTKPGDYMKSLYGAPEKSPDQPALISMLLRGKKEDKGGNELLSILGKR